jgi:two-component system chemotaxis sensor kinase CheA
VLELVRASANSENNIEWISDTPVLRLRNRLLPLVNLRELMNLAAKDEPAPEEPGDTQSDEVRSAEAGGSEEPTGRSLGSDAFIVVAQVGSYTFGIIVDRVFDTEEIVVKPVARILRDIQMFSGNTILGDGSVVMILDPNGIAAATGEVQLADEAADAAAERQSGRGEKTTAMLVFHAVNGAPKAVPLGLVARLEEIDLTKVETSNDQRVVQYRGQLMPLVQMEGASELGGEGRQPVLVFSDRERSMGLVVDEIVDIVEEHLNVELSARRDGYVGSAVIAGKATDIVDAGYYLTQAFNDWFGGDSAESFGETASSRILLVDDSAFFRNLLSPMLSVAGYEVISVDSANAALEMCESGEEFDIIISDIEMPGMNGFEFAEAVKGHERWRKTPIVALSSYATPKDLARGRDVGFADYVAKNDREGLLSALNDTLAELRGAA